MSFYTTKGYDDFTRAIEDEAGNIPCAQTDPDIFFPELGKHDAIAKVLCQRCPVKLQCLEYALTADERFGIWGGLTPRERDRLKNAATTRG